MITTYSIYSDWRVVKEFSNEDFHKLDVDALAPSERPASFDDKLEEIWGMGYDGRHTTMCCIDDGCDLTHENFEDDHGESRIRYSESNVRGEKADDGGNHGTHVLGTMGGYYTGVAPKSRLEVYKGLNRNGSGSSQDLTDCDKSIARRVKSKEIDTDITPIVIVNRSYGGGWYQPQEDAIDILDQLGVDNVASAGNSGHNGTRPTCGHPGNSNYTNGIGATNLDGSAAGFTSQCKQVDVSAHGVNVLSSIPGGRYALYSGTSMSGPWIAGAISLIQEWCLHQGRRLITGIKQWTNFWMANAVDAGKRGHDWIYGWGIFRFEDILDMIIRGELKYA